MSEIAIPLIGAAIMLITTYGCVYWMERTHKRNLHEMQERHEERMAEWRSIAKPPADATPQEGV